MARSSTRAAAIAVALTLLVLVVAGLAYIYSGSYNVAATDEHGVLGRWVLNTTQHRSIAVRVDDAAALEPVDSATRAHGFEHFRSMCVMCHGAPGVERGEIGKGLTPTPPELSEEAAEWSAPELFWIVKHGIKLAGMPAFGPTHSDHEIRGIVAFLEELPGMSPQEYATLEARFAASADSAAGEEHTHAPGTPAHSH